LKTESRNSFESPTSLFRDPERRARTRTALATCRPRIAPVYRCRGVVVVDPLSTVGTSPSHRAVHRAQPSRGGLPAGPAWPRTGAAASSRACRAATCPGRAPKALRSCPKPTHPRPLLASLPSSFARCLHRFSAAATVQRRAAAEQTCPHQSRVARPAPPLALILLHLLPSWPVVNWRHPDSAASSGGRKPGRRCQGSPEPSPAGPTVPSDPSAPPSASRPHTRAFPPLLRPPTGVSL
jgi:hypothetical protein